MKSEIQVQAQDGDNSFDVMKLIVAGVLVCAGLAGYYIFKDQSALLRIIGLLVCVIVAIIVALRTAKGREVATFFHEAQIEVRRVVWPTREETMQTTLLVMGMVIVAACLMWILDLVLGHGIKFIIGTGI